ncbi:MAG: hypothetical protein LW875_09765 [Proteobacteria bacterium]|jgi:hypothetical protein|nr:hypothetical protein [Pseudomonadota bacterium]
MYLELFFILLLSQIATATSSCFLEPGLPRFLKMQGDLYHDFSGGSSEKMDLQVRATQNSCREILWPEKHFQYAPTLSTHALNLLSQSYANPLLGRVSGAFSSLQGSKTEKNFKAELEEIKTIKNRNTRIRRVYELIARTMGAYDDALTVKEDFLESWLQPLRPSVILARARTKGTGGVCRHHEALLHWALLQVARPAGEKTLQLTENSFSVSTKSGCDDQACHVWVQLNLPYPTDRGLRFENVDLDTTWYQEPTILYSRNNGFSPTEKRRLREACKKVISCLLREARSSVRTAPQDRPWGPSPVNSGVK